MSPLRNTMADERISYLVVLHIHKHKDVNVDNVDIKSVATNNDNNNNNNNIYIYINCNARVRLFGHLFATLSFMLHAKQSSGDCQK